VTIMKWPHCGLPIGQRGLAFALRILTIIPRKGTYNPFGMIKQFAAQRELEESRVEEARDA
jgi:hypothetical protein